VNHLFLKLYGLGHYLQVPFVNSFCDAHGREQSRKILEPCPSPAVAFANLSKLCLQDWAGGSWKGEIWKGKVGNWDVEINLSCDYMIALDSSRWFRCGGDKWTYYGSCLKTVEYVSKYSNGKAEIVTNVMVNMLARALGVSYNGAEEISKGATAVGGEYYHLSKPGVVVANSCAIFNFEDRTIHWATEGGSMIWSEKCVISAGRGPSWL
jgi:hypothetical protein